MPGLAPIHLEIVEEDWKDAKLNLLRTLNYLIKDIYEHLGIILGVDDKVFQPESIELPSGTTMTEHNHTSAAQGGDHPWADLGAGDVTYLQSLIADIVVTNLVDKSASEIIAGTWQFTNAGLTLLDTGGDHVLTLSPGSDLTANRVLTITTGDADRTITLSGNPTLADWFDQAVKTTSSPTFDSLTITEDLTVGGTAYPIEDMAYFFGSL